MSAIPSEVAGSMEVPDGELHELHDALRTDPANTNKLYKLGRAYEALGRLQDALAQFEAIVRLEPDDHESLHAVGLLHYKLGHTGKAVSALHRATEIWHEQPDYFADLGDALLSTGDAERARHAYETALSLTLPHESIAERIRAALDNLSE